MTPSALCAVIVIASQSFASLSEDRVELACAHAATIIEEADRYGFEPTMLFAQIWVESRWVPDAVSRAGACGLTQVLPRYVDETCDELKDPTTSIRVGAASLHRWSTMRVRRDGRIVRVPRTGGIRAALACYNAGNVCLGSARGTRYADSVLRITARADAAAVEEERGNRDNLTEEQHYYSPMDLAYNPVLLFEPRGIYWPVLLLESLGAAPEVIR
jgi:soluble lytic murein transglycosylase-like protein